MGFTGIILVAKSEQPLDELDCLRGRADSPRFGADGWQYVYLETMLADGVPLTGKGDESLLTSVLERTGHPVFAALVLHSDGAQVVGYSRAGRWSGWLDVERIVDYLPYEYRIPIEEYDDDEVPGNDDDLTAFWQERYRMACEPLYEFSPRAEVAAVHAVAWAREAGLSPDPDAVLSRLAGSETFAEGLVLRLLVALGVPSFG
jgi:hypothetical protein